jgi:DNA-binding beta-propeller fold protein YncE
MSHIIANGTNLLALGNNFLSTVDKFIFSTYVCGGSGSFSLPFGAAINPTGTLLYVPNSDNSTVSVINIPANTLNSVITTATGSFSTPVGAAINPAGTLLYVPNQTNNTVSVLNNLTAS